MRDLKRVLAEKTLEVDFFKGALQKIGGSAPGQQRLWRDGIYDQMREVMPMQGGLSIERMCELARVSRAGFYRSLQEQASGEEDVEVRSVIQRIALEHRRRYGYRRVTAELRRRGMLVNHKRVWRMMREDNLLAVQPKAFVTTTDSNQALEIYLEPGAADDADGNRSALGGRHHLHSLAGRVRLSGCHSGRLSLARLWAGGWTGHWLAVWQPRRWKWRLILASRCLGLSIIRIAASSMPRQNTLRS